MARKLHIYLLLAGLAAPTASATTVFVPTFTSAFNSNFGANAVAAQNAWITAANILGSSLNDNIHINVTVDGVAGTGTLGASNTFLQSVSFLTLFNHLVSDATSADDLTATGAGGSLANGTDQLGLAADHNWFVSRAQAKALSLLADDLATDGTTTFGAGFSYTFSGPIASGTFDFQGIVLHELTEVMGRIGISGGIQAGKPSYTLVDAYSFSGSGTRVLGNGANASFSISLGATLLKAFNDQATNGGDSRDWASGSNDAFNAFTSSGIANPFTAVDLRMMDVLGYNLTSPNPEPSSIGLMSAGLLGLIVARRRKRQPALR